MERRKFLRNGLLLSGIGLTNPLSLFSGVHPDQAEAARGSSGKKAKNIIFMISDGMSNGTLTIANTYQNRHAGQDGHWMQLYKDRKAVRALMDTASASSIVTDSAAASSSFGSGFRVSNGSLNVGKGGIQYLPIWKKFMSKGKKAGCVTTVTATHATPAGFCVNSDSRNAEADIAVEYAQMGIDVLMGGGDEFFNPRLREDGRDIYRTFEEKGYQLLKHKGTLPKAEKNKKTLGIFSKGALPYSADSSLNPEWSSIPSLSEMTSSAIDIMRGHPEGFVLQVEAGKVDWAAHANDISALIHDQIEFDRAIGVVMDFAEKDGETLVIITTDHGNANPGILYGKDVNKNFDHIRHFSCTNEWLLNSIRSDDTPRKVKDLVEHFHQIRLTDEEAEKILSYYSGLEEEEEGLYNYRHLPFSYYAEIQKKHSSIGWVSMNHTGDYVELALYGPGSELLPPFVKNTDLHYLMLEAAQIENKF